MNEETRNADGANKRCATRDRSTRAERDSERYADTARVTGYSAYTPVVLVSTFEVIRFSMTVDYSPTPLSRRTMPTVTRTHADARKPKQTKPVGSDAPRP